MAVDPVVGLPHDELAALGREFLLAGHLIDRAGMPALIGEFGIDAMREVAIDEWMAASPIYAKRIQRLLGFAGDDVPTIFKGMQFDIGAPHEFMDFRYQVHDRDHGEFWLAHCGALMDVEPMGEDFVVTMCHHIEDPTFDGTAYTTNPKAQVRPIHRPPRTPSDRHPHCHWTVEIAEDAAPLCDLAVMDLLVDSRAAATPLPVMGRGDDGWNDYGGDLDPDLRLEQFSSPVLRALLDEFALQGHLLARSFLLAVARRKGAEAARRLGSKQLNGIAGLTAKRLGRHFGTTGSLSDIATVVASHPAFRPRSYVALDVACEGSDATVTLADCPALHEADGLSWPALLADGHADAINTIIQAINPRAQSVATKTGGATRWHVWIDETAVPARESDDVLVTAFSTGAEFQFRAAK
jgi:hypothetical protein